MKRSFVKFLSAVLLTVTVLASGSARAGTLECAVIDPTVSPPQPESHLTIQFDRFVQTVTYFESEKNKDGTYTEKAEVIYGQGNRGGLAITSCSEDTNEVDSSRGSILLFSTCAYGQAPEVNKVYLNFRASSQTSGQLWIVALPANGDVLEKRVYLEKCK